jgi:hypothetical protein
LSSLATLLNLSVFASDILKFNHLAFHGKML